MTCQSKMSVQSVNYMPSVVCTFYTHLHDFTKDIHMVTSHTIHVEYFELQKCDMTTDKTREHVRGEVPREFIE